MNKFWLVWREDGSQPTYKHDSINSAKSEAERLAITNQGKRFHVLQLVGSVSTPPLVEWEGGIEPQDDVPF